MTIVWIILAFVAVAIVVGVLGSKYERERREALAALAQRLGLMFDPGSTGDWTRHPHFGVFNRGFAQRSYNTMRGTLSVSDQPLELVAGEFEYKETSGSGKDRRTTTYHHSYVIIRPREFVFMQKLDFRREGLFDKLKGAMGFDDINFESAEFSRKFHVQCDDKKFAYDLFDPRMIEWIMQNEPPTGLQTAFGEAMLCFSGRSKPEVFEQAIIWLREFFSRWPGHLVNRLESPAKETV